MKPQYYDLYLLFHLHLNMENGVTFLVSFLNVIRFDLENQDVKNFLFIYMPQKNPHYIIIYLFVNTTYKFFRS